MHVHDRYYDTAVKNKYYSQSFTLKGDRELNISDKLSLGFGGDYNYTKVILKYTEAGALQQWVIPII